MGLHFTSRDDCDAGGPGCEAAAHLVARWQRGSALVHVVGHAFEVLPRVTLLLCLMRTMAAHGQLATWQLALFTWCTNQRSQQKYAQHTDTAIKSHEMVCDDAMRQSLLRACRMRLPAHLTLHAAEAVSGSPLRKLPPALG